MADPSIYPHAQPVLPSRRRELALVYPNFEASLLPFFLLSIYVVPPCNTHRTVRSGHSSIFTAKFPPSLLVDWPRPSPQNGRSG